MNTKIKNLAKLIGECDNKELNDVITIVKNHRKKLAHTTKLNLNVGMKVNWGALGHGVIDKINHTNCKCTRDDGTLWTVPITMIEVA